jgi:hypothetical protein
VASMAAGCWLPVTVSNWSERWVGADSTRALRLGVLVGLVVTVWAIRPLWDIDLFWHVAIGRVVLESGLPRTDVFSAANPAAEWHTFQWAYEVLVAAVDRVAGLRGLQLLHASVIGLAFGGLATAVCRWKGWLGALTVCAVGLLLFEDRVRERPHVFELLFVVGLLPVVLERVRVHGAVLVAVGVVWANLHAVSALWWFALVGAWALRSPRRLGWVAAGGLAMAAISPVRNGLWGALGSHSSWPSELVPELQGTLAYAEQGWWGVIVLSVVAMGLFASFRVPKEERLIAVGCAVAACLMARWAWFAAIPLGLYLARLPPRVHAGTLSVVLVLLGARAGARWPLDVRFGEVLQPGTFPVQACEAASGLPVGTDTYTQWSGYWLYCNPGSTVLGDGRLVFGEDVVDLLLRRTEGDVHTFDEAVGTWHTLALVWPTATAPPLAEERWRVVHQDEVATVWVASPGWGLLEP